MDETCEERVENALEVRMDDLSDFMDGEGRFEEYSLAFDWVEPNTWNRQPEGYFRYQTSWGGPSDEIRFFVNPDLSLHKAEYWFMDWGDGAKRELSGKYYRIAEWVYDQYNETEITGRLINESRE